MNKLEKDIEQKLRKMVESHGGQCLKWVCPGWSGVPDRIILLPGGSVMFVETKRPKGGKLSEMQKWWHKRLRALDFWVFTVWDDTDVLTMEVIILDELAGNNRPENLKIYNSQAEHMREGHPHSLRR